LARRILRPSAQLCPSLLLVLSLSACRHEQRAPAPSASASVSALGGDFSAQARERHFQEELARARTRFQATPSLAECAKALHDKADLELCQAAQSALAALATEPATTADLALSRLAPAALALVRLSQRLRYLSLAELAARRVERDAGAASAAAASAGRASDPPRLPGEGKAKPSAHGEQRAFALGDGPVSQLMEVSIRSERDVLRNIATYLEYGALPDRRAAFDAIKGLRAEHPGWPSLEHLLQEAAVLEMDAALKGELRRLSKAGSPQLARPDQSAGTK